MKTIAPVLSSAIGVMLLAEGFGGTVQPDPPPSRTTIEAAMDTSIVVYGRYAVARLPITNGVVVNNPAKIVRSPDGRMFVANHTGEIYWLADSDGDGLEDTANLFCDVREDGLRAPAGLTFRGDELFVGTAQEVRVYVDRDSDGAADSSYTFFGPAPHSEHPYEWTSALTFGHDEHLYLVLTTDSWNAGASPDPDGWRGALLRISPDGREVERFATGVRSAHGMVVTPEGDLLFSDNEGGGNPVEELNLATRGAFYGHNPNKYGALSTTEPIHTLRTEVAPAGMAMNPHDNDFDGTAGDLFVAFYGPGERWERGGIGRVRLQKRPDGGFDTDEIPVADLPKLSDLEFGPDGSLYATQVGRTDYWYQSLGDTDGAIYRIFHAPWVTPAPISIAERSSERHSADKLSRGQYLFDAYACSACHAVDGKTELLGPNLKDIGHIYSREELIEEIQQPSLRIKPSMGATRVELADGSVLLGRVVGSDSEKIQLMVIGNRVMDIARSDIAREESVAESLMWPGLLTRMSEEDIDALLSYLESLHLANEPTH